MPRHIRPYGSLVAFLGIVTVSTAFGEPPPANELGSEDDGEVQASPQYENSKFQGYEIKGLTDKAMMKQLGLKKGDVLINGDNGEITYTRKGKKQKISQQNIQLPEN